MNPSSEPDNDDFFSSLLGNEEHVAQMYLEGTGPWEQMVSNGTSDPAQAEFVAGFTFLKQRHSSLRALPLGFVEINPGK